MMAAILNSTIFNSAILYKTLKFHLIILTQLDDGNHLGFSHFAQNSDSN